MSELQSLYQEIILEHCKRPRNFGPLAGAARSAEGYNPLCGDKVRVWVELDGDRVERATFEGAGCAISTASASLLTEAVAGRTVAEARELFRHVHAMLTTEGATDEAVLGKLMALGGVRAYPMRVKCATLAWHTLQAALDAAGGGEPPPVSTE
jgi:nitrogen fixation protein NifU and related proteins